MTSRPIHYLSVCSGIEAATEAWHPLGWRAVAFAEIEPFPCAVLAHRYPDVPNLGDLTRYEEWPLELLAEVDVLVGGTPCQAFSVAGARQSLADDRGNLTLIYANLLDRIDSIRIRLQLPPAVCVWENVPGVLSTKDNAFGCFLAELAGEDVPLQPPGGRWTDAGLVCGPKRAVAWRILDAQYFGLAQRRRRVFLVAGAGEGFNPAEVLFEFQGMRRDSPPSREPGEGTSRDASIRTGGSHWDAPGLPHPSLNQSHNTGGIGASNQELFSRRGAGLVPEVAHTLRGKGFDAGEDGTGRGTPLVPICMETGQARAPIGIGIGTTLNCNHEAPIVAFQTRGSNLDTNGEISGTIGSNCDCASGGAPMVAFNAVDYKDGTFAECDAAGPLTTSPDRTRSAPVVAFNLRGREGGAMPEIDQEGPAVQRAGSGESSRTYVSTPMAVRRLTPRECERLQGFPDDYTLIPYRGKPAADGPRYKALGNSKAVPVVRWLGRRIGKALSTTPTDH